MRRWFGSFLKREEQTFVEAAPSLSERLARVWYTGKRSRPRKALHAAALIVGWPLRAMLTTVRRIAALPFAWLSVAPGALRARRLRHLLQGLPVLLALSAVVVIGGAAWSRQSGLVAKYRIAAARASAEEGRVEEAKLLYERLFYLDGGSPEASYGLGVALGRLGDEAGGAELIRQAADAGHAGACLWAARQALADKDGPPAERLRTARGFLLRAERNQPENAAIQLELARVYVAAGDHAAAVPKLAAAAKADPGLLRDLARLHAGLGQQAAAREAFAHAVDHFRRKLELDPDDAASRLRLAECLVNVGRSNEALGVLHAGHRFDPQGPFGKAIATILLAAYDRAAAQPNPNYPALLALLREALALDPNSTEAAARLAAFGEPSGGASPGAPASDIARQAEQLLRSLLASGEQPAAVHMALGLKAWQGERPDDAQWHFEQAYEADPSFTGVANNLAWVLAHRDPPELERALRIIDPVVERWPDITQFRETRGQILLRLGRWAEALRDLERALPGMRDRPEIHRSLATAYENLGRTEIAQEHQRAAEQLEMGTGALPQGDAPERTAATP